MPKKNVVNLSLNVSYHCNFRCGFCYLTEKQLSDTKKISLESLKNRLDDIERAGYHIGHVDLYGGEVLLLSFDYLIAVKKLLRFYGAEDIEIITNLSTYREDIVEDNNFGISVSYDFQHRQQSDHVWKNMLKVNRDFTILTLGIPEIVRTDPMEFIEQINLLSHCKHWEIKPYSANQANQLDVSYEEYEEFIKKIIEYPNKKFEFLNKVALDMAVHSDANPYSDDHVYITPNGTFAVLEFDANDNEYFQELHTFQQYLDWTLLEKSRVLSNEFCGTCNYSGRCISEHLREVKTVDQSCNGFYKLIEYYENRINTKKIIPIQKG